MHADHGAGDELWAWDFLFCGFLAVVSWHLLAHCFSLCDLRLFVAKRILLSAPRG